ncbi:ester cyclase [Streptomyces sp. N2-109]|uniref:Ester cyclase n=1 Tax=Streptomyces gossypii TaxID=2883101 RepID=A0ABT2JNY0_9ACTN|nr:ester cyclase [Streptomyces gossypii]MCT2589583.1 ester cyclase [Streptomyces gossypii]
MTELDPQPDSELDLKAHALDILERVWNGQEHDLIYEFFLPDVVCHFPTMPPKHGREIVYELGDAFRQALPDYHNNIITVLRDGDWVFLRDEVTGTQDGVLMGIPGTGLPIVFREMWMFRFEGDKIAEFWQQGDYFGFLQQIGVAPPLGAGALESVGATLKTMGRFAALQAASKRRAKAAA